jgi:hypothetical protein
MSTSARVASRACEDATDADVDDDGVSRAPSRTRARLVDEGWDATREAARERRWTRVEDAVRDAGDRGWGRDGWKRE